MRARESSKWRFGQEIRSIRSVKAINPPWAAETPMPQGQTEEEIALLRAEPRMSSTRTTRKSSARRPGTADRACRAHLQLGVQSAGAASAPGRAAAQRFGEDVYVQQFKLKAKAPSEGDVWQWHQD
jgi:IS5 family transposase